MVSAPRQRLAERELGEAAARVLRSNDRGTMTVAAPRLYPHQWSWDAAFVAIGLAHLSVPRACVELDSLLAAQWRTGMIPHIVFADDASEYFPGPQWWRCAELTDAAPRRPATSGICQPPVHAIAVDRILAVARRRGGRDREVAEAFVQRSWPALYAWHRWLVTTRADASPGLVVIVHGWESGMDNSPRWDEPYAVVNVGPLPAYRRTDVGAVGDHAQRPEDAEYDRYLWLAVELRRLRYDDVAIAQESSFRVGDVFATAVLAVGCDVLAELAPLAGRPDDQAQQLRGWADRLRGAVVASADPASRMARDHDLRAGRWLGTETVAGFAPLLCGGLDQASEQALLAEFDGPHWCGAPGLFAAVPPSTRPGAAGYDARRYWRGPLWPHLVWLFGWAFERRGCSREAEQMRKEGLALVADGTFAEYYEPYTANRWAAMPSRGPPPSASTGCPPEPAPLELEAPGGVRHLRDRVAERPASVRPGLPGGTLALAPAPRLGTTDPHRRAPAPAHQPRRQSHPLTPRHPQGQHRPHHRRADSAHLRRPARRSCR